MPARALKPCAHPGCGRLTRERGCDEHQRLPDARGPRKKKYDLRAWRDGVRPAKLRDNPLCEACEARGLVVLAQHVDHIDGNANNDAPDNLRSLCPPCHSRKTVLHDGGFGRAKR